MRTPNWLEQDPESHHTAIESSRFGRIPAELRLRIYGLLVEPCIIQIWRNRSRLSNNLCSSSKNDKKSFGPVGTLKELITSNDLNQDAVVEEAYVLHDACSVGKRHHSQPHLSFSLFLTCRLIYAEARDIMKTDLIARLPSHVFTSIPVINPPLPLVWVSIPATRNNPAVQVAHPPKWCTKLIPSHSLRCLYAAATGIMEARIQIRKVDSRGEVSVSQRMCCELHRGNGQGWWERRKRDMEVKWVDVFGV
ncbi:MAG: hypothetical protein Q9170_006434 [Blastenia crenularia]